MTEILNVCFRGLRWSLEHPVIVLLADKTVAKQVLL